MLTELQQHQIINAIFLDANEKGDYPLAYAGHDMVQEGMRVRFFALIPVPNGTGYGTLTVKWSALREYLVRFGCEDVLRFLG